MNDRSGIILAASTNCLFGFDPLTAFTALGQSGIRYVEVPAIPPRQALRWGLTTFAPELMDDSDVAALQDRLDRLRLEAVTVAAMCDVLDASQAEALRRRVDFAVKLNVSIVIADAGERVEDSTLWRRTPASARSATTRPERA
jgi:hypothetical protein